MDSPFRPTLSTLGQQCSPERDGRDRDSASLSTRLAGPASKISSANLSTGQAYNGSPILRLRRSSGTTRRNPGTLRLR